MKVEETYSYKTSSSKLVQVAEIASRYKGRPEMLMKVIIQVQKIVPAFSASVASVIAREMGIPQTDVYSFVTFYAMLSVKPRGKYIIRMCKSVADYVKTGGYEALRKALSMSGGFHRKDRACLKEDWLLQGV